MSQADHVLSMLNQITTGLRDKELEYSGAISQSCTFIANQEERDAAKEAIDLLYEIQRVLHQWQRFVERLSIDAAQPDSPASKMLTVTAELMDVVYSDAPLRMLLLNIETFQVNHISGLPAVTPPEQEDEQITICHVETGTTEALTIAEIFDKFNITQDALTEQAATWEQVLEDQGWDILAEEDYESAAAQADRTT